MYEVVAFSVIIFVGIILLNSGAVLMNLQRYKQSTVNDTISGIDIDNNTKILTTETDNKTSLGTIPEQRQDSIRKGIDNAEITSEKIVDKSRYDSDFPNFRRTDGINNLRSLNSHDIKRFSSFSKELPTTVPQQSNRNVQNHQQQINVLAKCENNVERHQSDKSNNIIYLEIIRDSIHTFEVNLNNANITLLRSTIRSMKTLKKDQQHHELLREIKRILTDTVNSQSDTKLTNINNEKKYFIIDEYKQLKEFFNFKVNKQYHFDITLKNTNAVLDIVLIDKKPTKTDNVSQNHDEKQINSIDTSEIQKSKIKIEGTKNEKQKITDQNDDKSIIKKHIEDTLVNYHINKIEIFAANYDIVNNNVNIPVFTKSSTQKLNHIFNRQKKEHSKNITGYNVDKKLYKNFIFTSVYANDENIKLYYYCR
ncbi:hypothetical protein BDAP_001455 [Binucleata daphniae]